MAKQQTLTTIITLKDQSFKDGLNRARAGLDQFKKQGGAVNSFLTGIFAGMGISVANLALTMVKKIGEGVNKSIHETQRMGDAWDNTVNTMKTAWKSFTRDLAMGTGLESLQQYLESAQELAKAMDNLGTSDLIDKTTYGYYKAKADTYLADARDKTKDKDSRDYAVQKADEFYGKAIDALGDNTDALSDAYKALVKTLDVMPESIPNSVKNSQDAMTLFETIGKQQKEPGKGASKINSMLDSGAFDTEFQAFLKRYFSNWNKHHGINSADLDKQIGDVVSSFTGGPQMKKVIEDLKKQGFSQSQIDDMVNEWKQSQLSDNVIKELKGIIDRMTQNENELATIKKSRNRLYSINTSDKTESGGTKTTLATHKVEKPVEVDVTFSRKSLDEEFSSIQDRMAELVKTYNETGEFNLSEYERLGEELDSLQEKYEVLDSLEIKVAEDGEEAAAEEAARVAELNALHAQRISDLQKEVELTNAYGEVVGNLGTMFGSLADIVGNDTPFSNFLSGVGAMATGIQKLINLYTSLMAVKAVEESVSSGEGIPYPWNLVAIASAAAIILGTIASVKSQAGGMKFAHGGIVPGTSFTGDNVLIRVNSGEAVLNREQQARLFRILDGGGVGAGAKANVEFVIKGDTLVGAINNHNKIRNY